MGSPRQFARAQSPRNAPVANESLLLAREFIQWPGQSIEGGQHEVSFHNCHNPFLLLHNRIHSSSTCAMRRGDGYIDVGGVYDSPEAQAYWATRFGAGFFTNLRALQSGINAAA